MYAVYCETADSHDITILKTFDNYLQANFHLSQIAHNHVASNLAYDKQLLIMSVSAGDDLTHAKYNPGLYLKPCTQHVSRLMVYRKQNKILPGYLWNGQGFEVQLLLWVAILDLGAQPNLSNIQQHSQKQSSQTLLAHGEQVKLIEELKSAIKKRTQNLNNVYERPLKSQVLNSFALELQEYIARKQGVVVPVCINNEKEDKDDASATSSTDYEYEYEYDYEYDYDYESASESEYESEYSPSSCIMSSSSSDSDDGYVDEFTMV